MTTRESAFQSVVLYHQRTKHHFDRYARSAGYLDWANQPDPFRRFTGAPVVELPLLSEAPRLTFNELFTLPDSPGESLDVQRLAGFAELSMGLSAWKTAGRSRWSLRMNPSSGNLHPTELYLLIPDTDDLAGGLYHYAPHRHALERRMAVPGKIWQAIGKHFGQRGFLAGLTSIYWREAWKYGERALRYCHLDVGHAIAALAFSARLLGWRLTVLEDIDSRSLGAVLGVDRTDWRPMEAESADLICWISPDSDAPSVRNLPAEIPKLIGALDLAGTPEPMSDRPICWDIIYRTAKALEKPETLNEPFEAPGPEPHRPGFPPVSAVDVIRRRRSALDFDPDGRIDRARLLAMLGATMPSDRRPPFNSGLGPPAVSLVLFLHRIDGLAPGAYAWMRHSTHLADLRSNTRPEFEWHQVGSTPLYLLSKGDMRSLAARLCCRQAIAGDSAFSLGMLARFEKELADSAWRYSRLHWEAGMIGQALYLAAEAHGLRGTGIGCYFDDPVHEFLGLSGIAWQTLYHFTIGRPIEDPRLRTLPPYAHLDAGLRSDRR
ncbi:MAG: SagB/ThcOx family dehydrogenase [Desulfobacterales bacterium]